MYLDDKIRVQHILEAISKIEKYLKDITYEMFENDEKTVDAVMRNLEIIGEAANHISKDFQKKNPQVKWKEIIGLRHVLIHDYYETDKKIVWKVYENDLFELKNNLQITLLNN